MTGLIVKQAGPGLTVQDMGRPGWLARGLSRGGAMDPMALFEGAALLGQDASLAAMEMAGMGGTFEAEGPLRVALTGAPMPASLDGRALGWHASHRLHAGQVLKIGPATSGVYGYLHLGGGVTGDARLGALSAHLIAGLGSVLADGDRIAAGPDKAGKTGMVLDIGDRFGGGALRILPTAQTGDFADDTRRRLAETAFARDPKSNRMALRLMHDGAGFALDGGLSVLSEITQPGDIQITGDGTPVILMAEAQTTGGYPRIATVLPADLPRAAQCPTGKTLKLRWIDIDEALAAEQAAAKARAALPAALRPLIRDPRDIPDLLGYTLIDGMVTGGEP